ncbi:MAG: tetratricopeptide repeat protein [Bacteroidales bacterium]|jgi:tetratricopeptide (TPR) repeat protein|nr:tetratricopeptide repeat protein [Bacteroidota bacterium]MDY0400723.1 tetratricopeptide repeat protein [Bacteroidales bacterium]HHW59046.1 tetratricopeptide repeat protein [Bacteroidales bacterium]HQD58231.1 tetratricopeptide repeat protein [Bacteroidales bacterium]
MKMKGNLLSLIILLTFISCQSKADKVKELKLDAITHIYKRDDETAKQKLNKAVKLTPNDPEIYYLMGNILFNESNYQEAINYYEKTIELDSTYAQAYTSLGKIYRIFNDRDKWCENFVKAYQLGDKTVYNDVRHCLPGI